MNGILLGIIGMGLEFLGYDKVAVMGIDVGYEMVYFAE